MKTLVNWIRANSAAVSGLVIVVMNLAIAFGASLTVDQLAAINAVVGAVLAFFTHTQSQPSEAVKAAAAT